jgi:uncharacterized protein GlcG (DUF336 family)
LHVVNKVTARKIVRAFTQRAGREKWESAALVVVQRDGELCAIYPEEVAPESIAALAAAQHELTGQIDPHRSADEFNPIKPQDASTIVVRSGERAIGAIGVAGLGKHNEEIARFCEDVFFGRKPKPRPQEVE